jgi:hypothetical protein
MTTVPSPPDQALQSSSAIGRAVLSDAIVSVDPHRADLINATTNWRTDYIEHFVAATALSAHGPSTTLQIASTGLASMREHLRYLQSDGRSVPLSDINWQVKHLPRTVATAGSGTSVTQLSIPFGKQELSGQALRDKLADWLDRGIIEPGFAAAIERAIDEPELLAAPGHQIAIIGAAAEMGPLEPLSNWGADVLAIDLPTISTGRRLHDMAVRGSGVVTTPQTGDTAGIDIIRSIPEAAAWIEATADPDKNLVIGMYGYANGAAHVALTGAADAIMARLMALRDNTALAYLGTPTDAYLVPDAIVNATRSRWRNRGHASAAVQDLVRLVTGGRMFQPAYPLDYPGPDGGKWGVADTMLSIQGPNYALAKRIQRWRAIDTVGRGRRASINVAPAAWTKSVINNRVFRVAYSGASAFGVEIFAADTARYLLAAKLAVDLADSHPPALEHPEALIYTDANHSGFWHLPLHPKSALPAAAAIGMVRQVTHL